MTYHGSQSGWAEEFVPIQTIQADAIHMYEPRVTQGNSPRLLANFEYKQHAFTMQGCNLLLPFCKVHEWDSATGKLVLEIECPTTLNRCKQIQQKCMDLLSSHIHWFQRKKDQSLDSFQRFIHQQFLTVYLHGPNPEKALAGRLWCWKEGGWKKGVDGTSFTKGCLIKLAIRFQGICMLVNQVGRSTYRVQHQVVAVYHKSTANLLSSSSSSV